MCHGHPVPSARYTQRPTNSAVDVSDHVYPARLSGDQPEQVELSGTPSVTATASPINAPDYLRKRHTIGCGKVTFASCSSFFGGIDGRRSTSQRLRQQRSPLAGYSFVDTDDPMSIPRGPDPHRQELAASLPPAVRASARSPLHVNVAQRRGRCADCDSRYLQRPRIISAIMKALPLPGAFRGTRPYSECKPPSMPGATYDSHTKLRTIAKRELGVVPCNTLDAAAPRRQPR
jgi:hypothetical protein